MNNVFISGATGGLGGAILEEIQNEKTQDKDIIILGGRNKIKIEEIQNMSNIEEILGGDLFEKETDPYKYALNILPEEGGIFFHNAAINLDPIPKYGKNGNLISLDYINPETGKKWNDDDNKKEIRKKIEENELNFTKNFIEKLLNRKSEKTLKIILAGSVMSKFVENPIVKKSSNYGKMKKSIYDEFINNREKLEKVGVTFNIVGLGLFKSQMLRKNILDKTAKLLDLVGPSYPFNGKAMPVNKPMETKEVAKKIIIIGNEDLNKISSFLPLYNTENFNLEELKNDFFSSRKKYLDFFKSNNLILKGGTIELNDKIKLFLIELRKDALEKYSKDYLEKLKNLYKKNKLTKEEYEKKEKFFNKNIKTNIKKGEEIISKLKSSFGIDDFIQICYRLEKNHP